MRINGDRYDIKPSPVDDGSGAIRCLALTKLTGKRAGEVYHCSQHDDGECRCTCPSFVWDHDGHPEFPHCRHLAALFRVTLLEEPSDPATWGAWSDAERWATLKKGGPS